MARARADASWPVCSGHFRHRRRRVLRYSRSRIDGKRETATTPETTMTTKRKRWSEMTTEELAAATKQFDDPGYDPPARKPSKRQLAQLTRAQQKPAKNRFPVAIALAGNLA